MDGLGNISNFTSLLQYLLVSAISTVHQTCYNFIFSHVTVSKKDADSVLKGESVADTRIDKGASRSKRKVKVKAFGEDFIVDAAGINDKGLQ